FREGLELVRDPLTRANLHARVGQTLVNLGAFREAEAELRACLAISQLHGDELGSGDAWIGLAGIALHEGALDEARERTVSAREHYLAARHRWGLATCQEMTGEIARHQRAWDVAIAHYRESGDIWRALGTDSAALYSDVNIAMVEVERGRAALVAAELEGCAARAEAFGIRSLWATVRIAQLVADAQAGQAEVWDRHLAEGAMALAETCLVSPDVATLAELAAQEARRRGWDARATEMHALALAQWQGLGRVEDVERLRRARS
ncbi:MAG: hypothetical protein KC621_12690, partial [Myxococcales bacterium]|nr:hypothetical protein [Myxococcales bacterium]